jgi:hypothetical protein
MDVNNSGAWLVPLPPPNATFDIATATPLAVATYSKQIGMIDLLVKSGASINTPDNILMTPLMNAVEANNLPAVLRLIALGANIDYKIDCRKASEPEDCNDGDTAYSMAIYAGNANILAELFKQKLPNKKQMAALRKTYKAIASSPEANKTAMQSIRKLLESN